MTIGKQIKYHRNKKGWTMKQLADAIGVHGKQTINAYESGTRTPSNPTMLKIAAALDCTYEQTLKPKNE